MPSFPGSTADNVELARLDGTRAFTGDVSMGTHKITGVQAGTAADHGVNKGQLDAVAAATSGKYGFQYTFGTGTGNVDPTSGKVTFDSATPSAVARINVDLIDADGNDLTNWLAALDDAIGTIKGFVYWRSLADDTKWGMYRLDSITSPGGYVSLNVTHIVSGLGGLPATTAGEVTLEFDAWGNGAAAGNGLTGTSTHSVLAADTTIVVGAGGVKRAPITGEVSIPDGSNAATVPALPDARVALWRDAGAMATIIPTGGGYVGVDPTLGLEWLGKNGVETTLTPHGDSGNTAKRRWLSFKTRPVRGTIAPSTTATIASFNCASLNGQAIINSCLRARLHLIAKGEYTTVLEYLVAVDVDGSSLAGIAGTPPAPLTSGGGLSTTSTGFFVSGSTVRFDVTTDAVHTTNYWAFWEIDGFEL